MERRRHARARRAGLSAPERGLRLFTDVRPGEGLTGVVLFADVFLILCAYYFVKALRDGWIAVSEVARALAGRAQGVHELRAEPAALVGRVVYARLSARWPRRTLITRVTLVCMANLVALLAPPARASCSRTCPAPGVVFYLWVGMFGVFVVAQFWTFAADLYAGRARGAPAAVHRHRRDGRRGVSARS